MSNAKYLNFIVAAALAACVAVWARIIAALIMNGALNSESLSVFLFRSPLVPRLLMYAFFWFVVIGSPVFFLARRRNRITLALFAVLAAFGGYIASFPSLLVANWAAMYAFSGLVGGVVCYGVLLALTNRSNPTRPEGRAA